MFVGKFILFKVPVMHAGLFLSSYPNHLPVRQGGSLLSYLRGLSVLLMEYFLCISPFCFVYPLVTVMAINAPL